MSGGHFGYDQYRLTEIADEIERLIDSNYRASEWTEARNYPPDILERFRETVHNLRRTETMIKRIDWLVCADDGVDTFRGRWAEEVPPPYEP